ncbi:MAG: LacI family DNA-binding transcriptional regulator [Wenzhouxiangellaceae bacterium]|nr:LacI family DNA-binding transcriptional regulator [Wenzhouxiangellaceae bacterium]
MHQKRQRPNSGRVTIDDVAEQSGVSIKTVSRVLNNEPNVRPSTRARVEAAVLALDYSPNPSARGLAGTHSRMIGLIYANPSPNYLFRTINGILEACNDAGYGLSLHAPSSEQPDLAGSITHFVAQSRVDGLLLIPPVGDIPAVLDALEAIHLPYARIAPLDGRPGLGVAVDDRHASAQIVEHLTQLGHTRIGFISGHPDHGATQSRLEGYRIGLLRADIEFEKTLVFQGLFNSESGREAGAYFLDLPEPPTAIFASNDEMAAGLLQAAHERQWQVPEQLSIVGFDDTPLSRMLCPLLTTVHQPIRHMALRATELLLESIEARNVSDGKSPKSRVEVFDAPLIVRGTTAAPNR